MDLIRQGYSETNGDFDRFLQWRHDEFYYCYEISLNYISDKL